MASSRSQSGWPGESSTAGRKRRGVDVDSTGIAPTPPRKRVQTHLPTPETGHRIDKRPIKEITQLITSATLPTPETLPRVRRSPRQLAKSSDNQDEPSPSGHTTYVLAQAGASRPEAGSRRRPGLTFAQQMASAQAGSSSGPSGSRHGVGVGMGGTRIGGHRVDRMLPGKLAAPARIEDDNPFLVSNGGVKSSPGRSTRHRPSIIHEEEEDVAASPRSAPRSQKKLRSPPMLIADPVHSAMGLLSPPQTQRATRIRHDPPPLSPRTSARQAREKEKVARLATMRDEDDNPFLVKPGHKATHRPGPVVDESRSTVTYIFRGSKKVFANPFYDPNVPSYGSDLPVEDEEYEVHPCPQPKLLWPSAAEITSTPKRSRGHARLGMMSDEEVSPPSSPMPTPHGPIVEEGRFESDDEFLPEQEESRPVRPVVQVKGEQEVRRGLLFGPGATIPVTSHPSSSGRSRRRL